MFPYSVEHDTTAYGIGTAPPMTNVNVQDKQTFLFDIPIAGTHADHSQGTQGHAWHGSHGSHLQGYAEASSYAMPNSSYTNGGVPPPSGFETQIVSDAQPYVPYPGYWPVNGGYQYHTPADPTTEHDSPFAMPFHPVVSQTSAVQRPVRDIHMSSASATFTSLDGTSSTPVERGMVSASDHEIAIGATTDAIYPHSTAMPPLAPVPSTAAPTSLLSDPEPVPNVPTPPVVRCRIDSCEQHITVDKDVLRQHLTTTHRYPAPHRSRSVLCRWADCRCTRPSTCHSVDLEPGHGVHIEDITEHVWTSHLNFQNICGKCGDARWVHGFSLQRHTLGCAGRKPARCVGCRRIFRSTVALAGHVELGQCVGAVHG
jgi:hypothetical protein